MSGPISRLSKKEKVTIASGAAKSGIVSMKSYAGGYIITPAAWTAASIGFLVSDEENGVFAPLCDQHGNLVEITQIKVDGVRVYTLPDEIFPAFYFQLWSETNGSDANQAAGRDLTITFKS
jgi:hypothetical protein